MTGYLTTHVLDTASGLPAAGMIHTYKHMDINKHDIYEVPLKIQL